jgi:hypothetical protein
MEIPAPADQLDHPALRLLALRPELFIRQGHVAASWRHRNGKTFGPYYRLSYRESGHQHSIYLGRMGELVERVRRQLDLLQRSLLEQRAIRRLERQIRASLRLDKLQVNALLRPYGLRLKGFEIRGWRFSPLRRFLPTRRRLLPRLSISGWKSHVMHPNRDPPPVRLARYLEARDRRANKCHARQ